MLFYDLSFFLLKERILPTQSTMERHTIKVHIKNAPKAIQALQQEPNRKVRIIVPRESLDRGGYTIRLTPRQYTFFRRKAVGDFYLNADIHTFGGDLLDIDSYYDFTTEDDLDTTTSEDINDMLGNTPGFMGVYANNEIPTDLLSNIARMITKPISAVINYDNNDQAGTHWVAIFIDPKSKQIEYFDPFGVPPKKRILNLLNRIGLPFIFTNTQLQHLDSHACGYYVAQYIIMRTQGMSVYDIIFDRFTRDPIKNEKILKQMVNEHSNQ